MTTAVPLLGKDQTAAHGSGHGRVGFCRQATETLAQAGFVVSRVNCGSRSPEQSAVAIGDQLMALTMPRDAGIR